jgi:hypothetical protein
MYCCPREAARFAVAEQATDAAQPSCSTRNFNFHIILRDTAGAKGGSIRPCDMALDPLTALSVAGTVVQFVDFGSKLLSRSNELYHSVDGALSVNEELGVITTDLLKLTVKLRRPIHSGGIPVDTNEDNKALENLCAACCKIAEEMIRRLEGLKVRGQHRAWKSIGQALKTAWTRGDMRALGERLEKFRDSLQTRILVGLRLASFVYLDDMLLLRGLMFNV